MDEYEEIEQPEDDIDPQTTDSDGPGGDELILGKFKSVKDLEESYRSLESAHTKATTTLSKVKGAAKNYGADIDEEGNLILPQNTTQPIPTPTDDDPASKFNEQFFENPMQVLTGVLGAFRQQINKADGNIEMVMATKESEPMFAQIKGAYKAALKALPDEVMADPVRAAQAADSIYAQKVGEYVVNATKKAKDDPAIRTEVIQRLGINSPQHDTAPTPSSVLNNKDKGMLAAFGLAGDDAKDVIKNYEKRVEED